MRAASLAVLWLLSCSCAAPAALAANEGTGLAPPPALTPGQAPPLPEAGPLAQPAEHVGERGVDRGCPFTANRGTHFSRPDLQGAVGMGKARGSGNVDPRATIWNPAWRCVKIPRQTTLSLCARRQQHSNGNESDLRALARGRRFARLGGHLGDGGHISRPGHIGLSGGWGRPNSTDSGASPRRGTSQALSNAKCSYLPARSEACSREKRNKWQGPAPGGKDAVYAGFSLEQA